MLQTGCKAVCQPTVVRENKNCVTHITISERAGLLVMHVYYPRHLRQVHIPPPYFFLY